MQLQKNWHIQCSKTFVCLTFANRKLAVAFRMSATQTYSISTIASKVGAFPLLFTNDFNLLTLLKYNVILIYQEMLKITPPDKRDAYIRERDQYAPISKSDQGLCRRIYKTWKVFENECMNDLGRVLLV